MALSKWFYVSATCIGLFIQAACVTRPSSGRNSPGPQEAVHRHQDPNQPNPDALPAGVMEWVCYVCEDIPDPEAKRQAIRDSEEQNGWTLTCPAESESAR